MDRGKLKEIEEKDAEIARLIYQQEKLKKAKREKAKQLKKEGQTEEGRGGRREYKHETRREERVSERDGVRHVTRVEEHVTRQDGVTRSHRSQHTRMARSTSGSGRTPSHLLDAREERALPPYRHPPPANAISSPNHSNHSESPPYDRPPLPPHPGTSSNICFDYKVNKSYSSCYVFVGSQQVLTNASNTQLDHFRKHLHHNVIRSLIAARVTRPTNSPPHLINNNTPQLITKTSAHPLLGTLYTKMCETCFIFYLFIYLFVRSVSSPASQGAEGRGSQNVFASLDPTFHEAPARPPPAQSRPQQHSPMRGFD